VTAPGGTARAGSAPAGTVSAGTVSAGTGDDYGCAQAWVALTAAHARVAGLLAGAIEQQCGLSINEFEILLRLDRTGEAGVRLGDLQTAVPVSQPALSRMVARMSGRGWLGRSPVPDDGRGVLITVTPAGRDLLRAAIPVHASTIRVALLDQLTSAEQDLLTSVLRRVVAG
jgi:DNA-binding MarR family transcriptional regulator